MSPLPNRSRKLHIGMITSAPFPPREGIGFYVWNLSRHLASAGHQIEIFTRGHWHSRRSKAADGLTLWQLPFLPLYPWHAHLHGQIVNQRLSGEGSTFDLLHLHSPLVVSPRGKTATLVTVHTPMRSDVAAASRSSLLGLLARLQGPVSYRIEQRLFENADCLTAVSSRTARETEAYGVDPKTVRVMGNGVDTKLFRPNRGPAAITEPYVLTVGRLGLRKGLEDVIGCAQIVCRARPDVRFLIAGTGPLAHQLERKIQRAGLEGRVQLLGHIFSRKQLVSTYQRAAVYLHPAHYEGLPTTLIEAMACGRPAAATAVGGIPDLIQDEVNGVLLPPHSPQLMANALLRILENPAFASALGAAARKRITAGYTWAQISSEYIQLYQQVTNGVCF